LQVGLELARPLEIAARIRSDPKPPRVLLLISTGSAVCFDYTDPETRTAPILTLKARLFTRNSTRKGAGRETGRPRNPKTTTPFAENSCQQPAGRSDADVSRGRWDDAGDPGIL